MTHLGSRWAPVLGLVAVLSAAGTARASDWVLDPAHTTATLVATPVKGTFEKVSGRVQMDDIDPDRSTFEFVLDAATVRYARRDRDSDGTSQEVFGAVPTPNITLKSTNLAKAGRNRFRATGDLTLGGVTRSVTCQFDGPTPARKDATGRLARNAVVRLRLSRKLWGLGDATAASARPIADTLLLEIKAGFLLANPTGEVANPVPSHPVK